MTKKITVKSLRNSLELFLSKVDGDISFLTKLAELLELEKENFQQVQYAYKRKRPGINKSPLHNLNFESSLTGALICIRYSLAMGADGLQLKNHLVVYRKVPQLKRTAKLLEQLLDHSTLNVVASVIKDADLAQTFERLDEYRNQILSATQQPPLKPGKNPFDAVKTSLLEELVKIYWRFHGWDKGTEFEEIKADKPAVRDVYDFVSLLNLNLDLGFAPSRARPTQRYLNDQLSRKISKIIKSL